MQRWQPDTFEKRKENLMQRAKLMRAVRAFFDTQDFLEVNTPALQVMPGAEVHVHAFQTERLSADLQETETLYLHTSPEFAMKKLLVAGCPRIYQICHVYRNAEGSRLHSCEFSMIEWYRAHACYEDIMADTIGLLRHVAGDLKIDAYRYRDMCANPFVEWEKITVCSAFKEYAGVDLESCLPDPAQPSDACRQSLLEITQSLGIHTTPDDTWDDLFFRIFLEKIEPKLGQGQPTILYEYPAHMAALSRVKESDLRFAERFEVYVCGIELANAFGELTDAKAQRARFKADMAEKKKMYGRDWPLDEDFLKALEYGMPEAGGIALGIDRLVMLACGAEDIQDVLWMP